MNWEMSLAGMNSAIRKGTSSRDPRAVRLFDKAYRNPNPNRLQQFFGQSIKPRTELSDIEALQPVGNRHYGGTQAIPVDTIHGTLNRADDFDFDFRPLQESDEERWCKVASAMLNGIDLPPIEVVQVGEDYFVKDGHHRISVARALGYGYLDAVIEVWNTAS